MDQDRSGRDVSGDLRVYFAAERTLLAWIRTGLAMMGFGFVVARFGLFLRELASVRDLPATHQTRMSVWVGTTLVLLGVAANVFAAIKHWRLIRRLEAGQTVRMRPMSLAIVMAGLLGVLGLLIAFYLAISLAEPA